MDIHVGLLLELGALLVGVDGLLGCSSLGMVLA